MHDMHHPHPNWHPHAPHQFRGGWGGRPWRGGWGPRPWLPMLIGFGLLFVIFGKLGFWLIPLLAIGAMWWTCGGRRGNWSRMEWTPGSTEKPKRDFVDEGEKQKSDDYV